MRILRTALTGGPGPDNSTAAGLAAAWTATILVNVVAIISQRRTAETVSAVPERI